jgi:ribosomal protein S18 acetylase RimI-like enzyme
MKNPQCEIVFEVMSQEGHEYLYRLGEATMRPYAVEVWGSWNESRFRAFYTAALERGEFFSIVERDNGRVGAISVKEHESHHQLEEIYIEPKHQNRGLGTAAVVKVMESARMMGKPVRLRVLAPNPAKRLYERLGFEVTKETIERYYMEWTFNPRRHKRP